MKNNLAITVIVAIVIGAGAFFGGMKYQQFKMLSGFRQFTNGNMIRNGTRQGARIGFRPINGEIIASDDKSITVKLADGSSKIILLSDKTAINKAAEATKADLKTGEKVAAFGTENSDGSMTAQNIQLNPTNIIRGNNSPPPNQ